MTSTENLSDQDVKDVRKHHLAALWLGIICVCVGVPVWWKTTEVYRVSLPYSDIQELADAKITYTTQLEVVWASNTEADKTFLTDLSVLLGQQMGKVETTSLKSLFAVEVREASKKERKEIAKYDLNKKYDSTSFNKYSVIVVDSKQHGKPLVTQGNTVLLEYNGADAKSFAVQISQLVRDIMRETDVVKSFEAAKGMKIQRPDKSSVRSYRFHPGYDVTFTLMVPEPDKVKAEWDIKEAVEDYLKPLQQSFGEYINITIASQVLYFIGIGRKPKQGDGFYYYQEQDLPHIINPLESKLGSHASSNPGMNFIVYIPTVNRSPLFIQDSQGEKVTSNAFLSPRWGGVMIYNPTGQESVVKVDMHKVMEVFVSQIRLLLNMDGQFSTDVELAPTGVAVPTKWELSAWLRIRTVENLAASTLTLQSLAQLLGEISNIVINDEIGKEVESAVASIREVHRLLLLGDLAAAFKASRSAIHHSELAFFHPSLLELLYFPEDQKFAIYIPLFLPISVPIITSLIQAVKYFTKKPKAKAD